MAFFKKLKDRLFKSSSKIDEGLEAIVEDGGQETTEPAALEPPPQPAQPAIEVEEPQAEAATAEDVVTEPSPPDNAVSQDHQEVDAGEAAIDEPILPDVEEPVDMDADHTTEQFVHDVEETQACLLYTSPSPRDLSTSRMPSSA